MKLINQSATILQYTPIRLIELAGRTCYRSEARITETSADAFTRRLVHNKHEAMLEHGTATVKFVTNRGVTHELVRHRLASFAQESTRYCRYDDGNMEFIKPVWLDNCEESNKQVFIRSLENAEKAYIDFIDAGWNAQEAREVLPNALKTEIVVTTNYREWRHIFNLRALGTTGKPHPQMQDLMVPLLMEFQHRLPSLFDDLVLPSSLKSLEPIQCTVTVQV